MTIYRRVPSLDDNGQFPDRYAPPSVAVDAAAAVAAKVAAEAARDAAQALTDVTVTTGAVVGDDLVLTRTDTTTVNVGNVRGPQGVPGPTGATGPTGAAGGAQIAGDLGGTAAAPTVTGGAHHSHTAAQVSDSTAPGRSLLTAADVHTQRAALSLGGLSPAPLSGVTVTAIGTTPRAIGELAGYVWGANATGTIYRSADDGQTWTSVTTVTGAYVRRLAATSDGETLAVCNLGIYKSTGWAGGSPTWTLKQAPAGTCNFLNFSFDGDGTRFITTEYSSTVRADSRYVRMSLDAGNTWNVVYDSVAVHGQTLADDSHLHGCAFDSWGNRWYICEGHDDGGAEGDIAGIYCSTDNGATWARAVGMKQNPAPTSIVATPEGLVCGSDHVKNGIYGVRRQTSPAAETLDAVWRWRVGLPGLLGFANSGRYDAATGLVYMSWTTAFATVAPIITAGTVTSGGLVWTWPTLPVANSDAVRDVLVTSTGRVLASAYASGAEYIITATTTPPGAGRDVTVSDSGSALGGTIRSGDSLAVGRSATASYPKSTAFGQTATAGSSTGEGTAGGYAAQAIDQGTALGANTLATGAAGATAIGRNAQATGQQGTAVGQTSKANASLATAVGSSAQASTVGTAVGALSNAGTSGTAVGYGALAPNAYSVALGRDTATTSDYQVHVGARHLAMASPTSAPAAPPAGGARLYARDNGAGKTQLCVRFATGAVQVIATEP